MKSLLLASILSLSTLNAFADSNSQLNACIRKTYQAALNAPQSAKPQDVLKFVAKDIKACKDSIKAIAKAEREETRKAKINEQIKKLQAKLSASSK
jgi:excinuclease UvrABC helicase subunit UvrB